MKYFIDTEFIEGFRKPLFGKRRHFIDLISIGIVCEDGRTYSAISNEWRYKDADEWVKKNVIIPLYISTVHGDARNTCDADNFHRAGFGKPNKQIAMEIYDFCHHRMVRPIQDKVDPAANVWVYDDPKFYGYYADYDWVLFCSLFGRMIDLPSGFPMYCRDLKQMMDEKIEGFTNSDFFTHFHQKEPLSFDEKLKLYKGGPSFPQQENEHNALSDSKWNKKLYEYLTVEAESREEEHNVIEKRSVLQDWAHELTFMQQSVLISSVRGPDGIRKDHPTKVLCRWLRRSFLLCAFDKVAHNDPYEHCGGSFTGKCQTDEVEDIDHALKLYLRCVDELPHHFQLHFMHAAEILGYKHPVSSIRKWWNGTYLAIVKDAHLNPESEEIMDFRLGDSERQWRASEVVTAK